MSQPSGVIGATLPPSAAKTKILSSLHPYSRFSFQPPRALLRLPTTLDAFSSFLQGESNGAAGSGGCAGFRVRLRERANGPGPAEKYDLAGGTKHIQRELNSVERDVLFLPCVSPSVFDASNRRPPLTAVELLQPPMHAKRALLCPTQRGGSSSQLTRNLGGVCAGRPAQVA